MMEYYLDGSEAICKYDKDDGVKLVVTVHDCDLIVPCTAEELKDIAVKKSDMILFDNYYYGGCSELKRGYVTEDKKINIQEYDFIQGRTQKKIEITEKLMLEDCYFILDNEKRYLYVNVEKTVPV